MNNGYKETLGRYFPAESLEDIIYYIKKYNIHLKITRKRLYKLGDYRSPALNQQTHRISINGDMNPYSTLLVFLHELGHLIIWEKYKKRAKPHGQEWKKAYGNLVEVFTSKGVFPNDLEKLLNKKLYSLKASFSSDPELYKTLASYDKEKPESVLLEDIPIETRFMAHNGKTFVKQSKRRTRFRCLCLDNQRVYLFHPLARIKPLIEENIVK